MILKIKKVYGDKRPYHIDYNWKSNMPGWDVKRVYEWCEMTYGHRNEKYDNPRWSANLRYVSGDFKFRNEKDAAWFVMRWS